MNAVTEYLAAMLTVRFWVSVILFGLLSATGAGIIIERCQKSTTWIAGGLWYMLALICFVVGWEIIRPIAPL